MIIGINGYAGSGKDTVGNLIQYLICKSKGVETDLEDVKDTTGTHDWWLSDQSGWEQRSWAGKLKTIASLLTGIPVEKFEDQEFKKTYLGPEWNYWTVSVISDGNKLLFQQGRFNTKEEAQGYAGMLEVTHGVFGLEYVVGMQQMTVRQFLQELGTDACRNVLHTNTWVNALMADYKAVWKDPDPIPKNDYTITYRENYGETSLIQYGGGSEAEVFNYEIVEPNWIITDTRFPNEAQAIKDAGGIVIRVDRPGVKAVNAHPSETGLDDWAFDHKIWNGSDITALAFTVENILKKQHIL